jgi:hypothetical protein
MTAIRKIGIIITLIGLCLPTVTLPFIHEFNPLPEVCLTSNFFGNLGNMVVVFGSDQAFASSGHAGAYQKAGNGIPYRYIFSSGVLLTLTGIGVITLSAGTKRES